MCKLDELRAKRNEIYRIAKAHKVEKLFVFGSCARKEETPDSDVDFIAKFAPGATLFDHAGAEYDIAEFLSGKVDIVDADVLKDDRFGKNVQRDMVLL
jgi:DNA polymerase beta domain protein region